MDYKRDNLNVHAFRALDKPVYAPSFNLNVEFDEYQGSYALLVKHTAKQPKMIVADPVKEPWEKTRANLQNEQIRREDFPQGYYMGSPLMGV